MPFLQTLQQICFHSWQPAVSSPLSSFTLTAAAPSYSGVSALHCRTPPASALPPLLRLLLKVILEEDLKFLQRPSRSITHYGPGYPSKSTENRLLKSTGKPSPGRAARPGLTLRICPLSPASPGTGAHAGPQAGQIRVAFLPSEALEGLFGCNISYDFVLRVTF